MGLLQKNKKKQMAENSSNTPNDVVDNTTTTSDNNTSNTTTDNLNSQSSTPAENSPAVPQTGNPSSVQTHVQGSVPPSRIGSLYVADLAPTVTESTLYDFFKVIGQNAIASIRVCRDSQTSKSLGYAYVNFHRYDDAEKAIDVLNYEHIEGRPCRISWSRRDPSLRKSGVGNVFIKNLAKDIDHLGLYDTFSTFGDIISCKVATDMMTGESKGYGFVHFASMESAEDAINTLNGKCLNSKQVYVGHFIPRHLRKNQSGEENFTNVYLKHIHPSITSEQFDNLVTKATEDLGKITSPKLMTTITNVDGVQKEESLRFGFVNFESHDVAKAALERFQDEEKIKELIPEFVAEGQTLYANRAIPKYKRQQMQASRPQNLNLYVKNIAEPVTEEELRTLFKPYGNITSLVIMQDPETKTNKGFGFVCYEKKEEAAQAMARMNNFRLQNKPLYVALAQPKAVRRQQLAQHYRSMPQHQMVGYGYGYPPMNMRYPRPNFAQRGRVSYPPAGRGMPYPPMRAQYPQMPYGAPPTTPPNNMMPSLPNDDKLVAELEQVPINDRIQYLGDNLFKILLEEVKDEYLCKRVVGTILSSTQNLQPTKTISYLLNMCKNESARGEYVQQIRGISK